MTRRLASPRRRLGVDGGRFVATRDRRSHSSRGTRRLDVPCRSGVVGRSSDSKQGSVTARATSRGRMMSSVSLEKVTKVYSNGFEAVNRLDLEIADGEFMVVVGPVRMWQDHGAADDRGTGEHHVRDVVRFGDEVMNDVAPRDRDVAMVFQSYALYPQMTVAQNIGFALRMRKVPKAEIDRRVRAAADVLGITPWLDRKANGRLSGGQRQRVAMGRAIVREPSVFLMDEPLSNLDAKLRVQLRAEISRVQSRIGVATIYVTHDQTEAMTLGHRVAVLRDGALAAVRHAAGPLRSTGQCLRRRLHRFAVDEPLRGTTCRLTVARWRSAARAFRSPRRSFTSIRRCDDFAGRTIVVGIRPEDLPAASDERSGVTFQGRRGTRRGARLRDSRALSNRRAGRRSRKGRRSSLTVRRRRPKPLRTTTASRELNRDTWSAPESRFVSRVNPERLEFFDWTPDVAIWE